MDIPKVRPLNANLIVELDEPKSVSKNLGIILLDGMVKTGHDGQRKATVLEVGPGHTDFETGDLIPVIWKKGDRVMLNKHGGLGVQPLDPKCRILLVNETDILGGI